MAAVQTLPFFSWTPKKEATIALLSVMGVVSLALLIIAILGSRKVGHLSRLGSRDLVLLYTPALLLGVVSGRGIFTAYKYAKREPMVVEVLKAWNRLHLMLSHHYGAIPHRISDRTIYACKEFSRQDGFAQGRLHITCDLPPTSCRLATNYVAAGINVSRTFAHPSPETPMRATVWAYAPWLRDEESVAYSFGREEPAGPDTNGLLVRYGDALADSAGFGAGTVTLEQLQARARFGDQGSILESVVTTLLAR